MSLLRCKVCDEDPFKCFHIGSETPVQYKGAKEFAESGDEIKSLRSKLEKTQISLGNMNAQVKANKKEYNLKVTYLMNLNNTLEEENKRLQRKIIELSND